MDQKKKVGNYLLVAKIGQGQFGKVYKGVMIDDQKKVFAVKCIEKKKLEGNKILNRLFQTEMSVMSKINHPNIMHLYEFMETGNNYYLVIQYCNNGDLESYLKKMGKLSEEEAVYFLMQIMNGFQELHKNKVMHRDVKLANIFLQDDKVVIGDFGFAKQGVDVTRTRLGTPITMAPELLTSKGGSYNSKADLWSIGVCFYQILFGKTPFDAKNYDDLKRKVKNLSGYKLRFPKDVTVSEECRNLLISLLQYDPKKRIEWKEFFNHKLFDLHRKAEKNELTQSMLYRENQELVRNQFLKNQKEAEAINDLDLIDPQERQEKEVDAKLEKEEELKNNQYKELVDNERLEELFKFARARYCHEKKKIIFIMYTVRKLRNLAKLKHIFPELADRLMYAACLLLHKGLLLNSNTIKSLAEGYNTFNLQEFDKFLKTKDNEKIQNNFKDDDKIYQTFSKQMNSKFLKEVINQNFKKEFQKLKDIDMANLNLLDEKMKQMFNYFYKEIDNLKVDEGVESQFCLAVLHFYYTIYSEETFPLLNKNKIFEWKSFEKENSEENAKNILKNI
jgi:serine/threonine protein kinase